MQDHFAGYCKILAPRGLEGPTDRSGKCGIRESHIERVAKLDDLGPFYQSGISYVHPDIHRNGLGEALF